MSAHHCSSQNMLCEHVRSHMRVPAALRETLVNKWKMTGSSPLITDPRVSVRSSEKHPGTEAQHDGRNAEERVPRRSLIAVRPPARVTAQSV